MKHSSIKYTVAVTYISAEIYVLRQELFVSRNCDKKDRKNIINLFF